MHGVTVPLVLLPRFTGFAGERDYETVPLDVTAWSVATLTFFRGPLVADLGSTPTYKLFFEGSHDATTWATLPPGPTGAAGFDPAASASAAGTDTVDVGLIYRWFRVRVELRGTNVAVTNWCTGVLEFRVD